MNLSCPLMTAGMSDPLSKKMLNIFVPPLAIVVWILLLLLLRNKTHSSWKYENWTLFADFGSLCCFYAIFSKHIWHIFDFWGQEAKAKLLTVHLAVACVYLIAGTSSLLSFIGWSDMRKDALGSVIWKNCTKSQFLIRSLFLVSGSLSL